MSYYKLAIQKIFIVLSNQDGVFVCSLVCSNPECGAVMSVGSLACQLSVFLHQIVRRYCESPKVCDDAACKAESQSNSVFGMKCLTQGCKGQLHREVICQNVLFLSFC